MTAAQTIPTRALGDVVLQAVTARGLALRLRPGGRTRRRTLALRLALASRLVNEIVARSAAAADSAPASSAASPFAAEEEPEPEPERVNCTCGDDDREPASTSTWVFCVACRAWLHGDCVGIDLQNIPESDFVCPRCIPQTSTTARRNLSLQKCTPWCPGRPRGCEGCEAGFGTLSEASLEAITRYVLDEVAHVEAWFKQPLNGDKVMVALHGGVRVLAVALLWCQDHVVYLPVSEMQRPVKEQSRRVVARSRATRLPPRYSAQDLEVAAVKMGCLRVRPYRKQLLFEMRRIRKALVKDGTLQRTNMKGVYTIRRGSVGGPATTRICGSADARDKKQQDSPAGSGSNRGRYGLLCHRRTRE